jgi:hypothetical protein
VWQRVHAEGKASNIRADSGFSNSSLTIKELTILSTENLDYSSGTADSYDARWRKVLLTRLPVVRPAGAPRPTERYTRTPTETFTPSQTTTRTKTPTKTRTATRTSTPHPPLLTNPSFESGTSNWTASSALRNGIIQRIPAISRSGDWLALLGDANGETATLSQQFYVLPTQKELTFWYKIQSTEACGKYTDSVRVRIGTTQRWVLDACKYQVASRWQSVTLSLKSVAGTRTTITFEMRTNRTNPSTWFVDDLQVR